MEICSSCFVGLDGDLCLSFSEFLIWLESQVPIFQVQFCICISIFFSQGYRMFADLFSLDVRCIRWHLCLLSCLDRDASVAVSIEHNETIELISDMISQGFP
ncbi:hypothetical protein H5410_013110 [Solanum commersonii]|uniref:Uncharacterized protein n=1 Tax=Solanum commersonii TaxID=4109 RepID=A0A9J6AU06_SOLCO|nr:hypothetical protein H5410_013110 [Solanum commersonii]